MLHRCYHSHCFMFHSQYALKSVKKYFFSKHVACCYLIPFFISVIFKQNFIYTCVVGFYLLYFANLYLTLTDVCLKTTLTNTEFAFDFGNTIK